MNQLTTAIKPRRHDFMKTIVLTADGSVVPDEIVKSKVGDLPVGKIKFNRVLAKDGMQSVDVFLSDQYNSAKSSFYDKLHAEHNAERKELIASSFAEAGAPPNKRVQDALKTILPLYEDLPANKVKGIFIQVIKVAGSTGRAAEEFIAKQKRHASKTVDSKASKKEAVTA